MDHFLAGDAEEGCYDVEICSDDGEESFIEVEEWSSHENADCASEYAEVATVFARRAVMAGLNFQLEEHAFHEDKDERQVLPHVICDRQSDETTTTVSCLPCQDIGDLEGVQTSVETEVPNQCLTVLKDTAAAFLFKASRDGNLEAAFTYAKQQREMRNLKARTAEILCNASCDGTLEAAVTHAKQQREVTHLKARAAALLCKASCDGTLEATITNAKQQREMTNLKARTADTLCKALLSGSLQASLASMKQQRQVEELRSKAKLLMSTAEKSGQLRAVIESVRRQQEVEAVRTMVADQLFDAARSGRLAEALALVRKPQGALVAATTVEDVLTSLTEHDDVMDLANLGRGKTPTEEETEADVVEEYLREAEEREAAAASPGHAGTSLQPEDSVSKTPLTPAPPPVAPTQWSARLAGAAVTKRRIIGAIVRGPADESCKEGAGCSLPAPVRPPSSASNNPRRPSAIASKQYSQRVEAQQQQQVCEPAQIRKVRAFRLDLEDDNPASRAATPGSQHQRHAKECEHERDSSLVNMYRSLGSAEFRRLDHSEEPPLHARQASATPTWLTGTTASAPAMTLDLGDGAVARSSFTPSAKMQVVPPSPRNNAVGRYRASSRPTASLTLTAAADLTIGNKGPTTWALTGDGAYRAQSARASKAHGVLPSIQVPPTFIHGRAKEWSLNSPRQSSRRRDVAAPMF